MGEEEEEGAHDECVSVLHLLPFLAVSILDVCASVSLSLALTCEVQLVLCGELID